MQKCEAHLSLRSPCTSSVGSVCVSVTPSGKNGRGRNRRQDALFQVKKQSGDSQFTLSLI